MSALHKVVWQSAIGSFAALLLTLPPAATAQTGPSFSVGKVSSAQTCTVYREYAGKSGAVVTPWAAAAYSSWRSWLVKDCVNNFATMRQSLQAALAGSGGIRTREGGGRYVISGTVSAVDGGGARPAPDAPDYQKFAISSNLMTVNMDITVRDAGGRIVFGGLLTKTIEVGSDIKVDGFRATSNMSGEAAYTRLQHEVALAVARMVVFHFNPLRAVETNGRVVRLNYGAPLLTPGMKLQAIGTDGQPLFFRVSAAVGDAASAEIRGDGNPRSLPADGILTAIEVDDPANNLQEFRRVDLP